MKTAIILFTRIPIPGRTKTRMQPFLSGNECAKLHKALLKDIITQCDKTKSDTYIYYANDGAAFSSDNRGEELRPVFSILGEDRIYQAQNGESLGDRMNNAITDVLKKGYWACIVIGSDVPGISAHDIKLAFRLLNSKDVVIGPADDGGYYLIGMKKPHPPLFEGHTYGHGNVLREVVISAQQAYLSIDFLRKLSDLDIPGDIKKFLNNKSYIAKSYSSKPGLLESHSAIYTKNFLNDIEEIRKGERVIGTISIIIPVYNEVKNVEKLMPMLQNLSGVQEIIFADGGSTDGTVELIHNKLKLKNVPKFLLASSEKGRGPQQNAGVLESTGDILFFLHCDSILPRNAAAQIYKVMRKYKVGGFGIRFDSDNILMKIIALLSNLRISMRNIIFGDQGIFIERKLFFEMGGFPEIPFMEDYQLSLNLKKAGIKIGMTKSRIITSARRYPEDAGGILKHSFWLFRLRRMYRNGNLRTSC
ncbi:MAG: TIGR04283 family arsenosugar biosynthesis glycosyltransferase [Lachnospiraceae bacterium]|jgi:rSAM/selenodomain-associated transferase 2/rSAM/selenodomain-associated transferase 1|nr:TIGR04283 family arsenosugar biosynthesis glycosyltransferase [Lachnospiraceae bacterium]